MHRGCSVDFYKSREKHPTNFIGGTCHEDIFSTVMDALDPINLHGSAVAPVAPWSIHHLGKKSAAVLLEGVLHPIVFGPCAPADPGVNFGQENLAGKERKIEESPHPCGIFCVF